LKNEISRLLRPDCRLLRRYRGKKLFKKKLVGLISLDSAFNIFSK
jgi:hypothetical protein